MLATTATIEEAAAKLGIDPSTLYGNGRDMGYEKDSREAVGFKLTLFGLVDSNRTCGSAMPEGIAIAGRPC